MKYYVYLLVLLGQVIAYAPPPDGGDMQCEPGDGFACPQPNLE